MSCRGKRKCNILPTLRVPGNTPYIGGPLVRTGIPFISDLVFDFDSRTNLNLVDNIAGELAPIQDFVVGDFSGAEWVDFTLGGDYNNTDFCFGSFFTIQNINNNQRRIIQKRGTGVAAGWQIIILNQSIFVSVDDGLGNTNTIVGAVNLANNTEYFAFGCFNNTTGRLDVSIYNINTGVLVEAGNNTVVALIGANFTTARRLTIGCSWDAVITQAFFWDGLIWGGWCVDRQLTVAEVTSLSTGTIPQSLKNSTAGAASNKICLDVYSGIDSSGNDFHGSVNGVTKGYTTFNRELFDYGFQQYWDVATGLVSLQVPYHIDGTPTAPGTPYVHDGNNYALSENHPTNAFHNLAECFIDFNPTNNGAAKFNIYNRSLGAFFNANARVALPVGFYNAAEPWTFHISELSQIVLGRNFYQIGQAGKHFMQYNTDSISSNHRLNATRMFVYGTDKTSALEASVLTFTNDITHAQGLNPATPSGYIEDANDYIILI